MSIEARLKRQQYHWLLGLRTFSRECEPNFGAQVIPWESNHSEVNTIKAKQALIRKKIGFIRLWYWLFNLKQYAEHHYLLSAYDALIQERARLMPIEKRSTDNIFKYVNPLIEGFRHITNSFNLTSMANDSNNETTAEQNQPDYFEQPISVEKQVSIESWMYPHLKTLGITESGGLLNRRDVKKAYLKQAILVHPDKNSSENAKEMFVNVSNAYKIIEHYFEYGAMTTSFEEWCWKNFSELDFLFKNMDTTLVDMNIMHANIDLTIVAINKKSDEQDRRIRKLENEMEDFKKIFGYLNCCLMENKKALDFIISSRRSRAEIIYQSISPDRYFLRMKIPIDSVQRDFYDYKTKKVLSSCLPKTSRTSLSQLSHRFFTDSIERVSYVARGDRASSENILQTAVSRSLTE